MSGLGRLPHLGIGVSGYDRIRPLAEDHLPTSGTSTRPIFLPETEALDAVLRPASLEERLAMDVVPTALDQGLTEPATMTETRLSLAAAFRDAVLGGVTDDVARMLEHEAELDEEIRTAMALVLRG
ncbi:MAG: hypothetical protein N4A39_14755 [Roseicyclus sp.]|nr:hypothetical protein [Roseicyclus sp.]